MKQPVCVFDPTIGITLNTSGDARLVTSWKDARHASDSLQPESLNSTSSSPFWNLQIFKEEHSPILETKEGCRPHLRFSGNQSLVLETYAQDGFQLDYGNQGSTIAIVIKNDRAVGGFHEIFGGAGSGPNAQIRFESPNELMVYPTHNFFRLAHSPLDEFHSYVFRSQNGKLEVFQDEVALQTRNAASSGVSTADIASTRMAGVGSWFSKHFLQGRIAHIIYYDSALEDSDPEWESLRVNLRNIRFDANAGWEFPAVDTAPHAVLAPTNPPASVFSPPSPALPGIVANAHGGRRVRRSVLDDDARLQEKSWANLLTSDKGLVQRILSTHRDYFMRILPSTSAGDTKYEVSLIEPLRKFELDSGDQEIVYSLAVDKLDEFEETFGDEPLIKNLEEYRRVLTEFTDPGMSAVELAQWQVLWLLMDQNENALSGLASGEGQLRTYYLTAGIDTSAAANTGIVLTPRGTGDEPEEMGEVTQLVLLHRDSSQECVSHGECALFIQSNSPRQSADGEEEEEDEEEGKEAGPHVSNWLHADTDLPVSLLPLAYGHYSMGKDLSWETPLVYQSEDGLLAPLPIVLDLMRDIQRALLNPNAQDRVLRHLD